MKWSFCVSAAPGGGTGSTVHAGMSLPGGIKVCTHRPHTLLRRYTRSQPPKHLFDMLLKLLKQS